MPAGMNHSALSCIRVGVAHDAVQLSHHRHPGTVSLGTGGHTAACIGYTCLRLQPKLAKSFLHQFSRPELLKAQLRRFISFLSQGNDFILVFLNHIEASLFQFFFVHIIIPCHLYLQFCHPAHDPGGLPQFVHIQCFLHSMYVHHANA